MQIKNRKLKVNNKGITLIALVITIIVLLILAGVAIATLTGDNGILTKAVTAKEKTTEAEAKEAVQLEAIGSIDEITGKFNKEDFKKNVKQNLGVTDSSIKESGNKITVTYKGYDVTVDATTGKITAVVKTSETPPPPVEDEFGPGKIVTGTENKIYTDDNGETATIPVGFGIVPGLDDISEGLVITDHFNETTGESDGNEFVWIPVPTAVSPSEAESTTNKAMAVNVETDPNAEPQYRGLLYNFTDTGSEVMSGCTTTTSSNREPDIVEEDNDTYLSGIGLTQASFQAEMQNSYNDMIKSVSKNENKGFYVSRYEMSLDASKNAQSKKNQPSATAASSSANMWYGLYNKAKNFALKEDESKSVVSSMIWGSQYDAMMNWMHKDESINVNSTTPITGATENKSGITGAEEKDKIKNVYDLLGNSYECTLEAESNLDRTLRGCYATYLRWWKLGC